MKKQLLLFILCQYATILLGQRVGSVDYIFIEKKTGSNSISAKKATLFFSQDSSLFIHSQAKAFGEEDAYWPENVAWFKAQNKENIGAYIVDPIGQGVFKNFLSQKMQFRQLFLAEPYTISEPKWLPLNWKIHTETKQIGSFLCKKATTRFRGRNYTAWFTPKIAVQDGPWKLHGCPGLILEAYDDTDEVLFLFEGIKYPIKNNLNIIKTFPIATNHTFEEFKTAAETEFQKMKRRAMSSGGVESGATITRIIDKEIELEF